MYKYHNTNQLILPLNLAEEIPSNHIVWTINEVVEAIPKSVFIDFSKEGRPAYHPCMMAKVILYAYTKKVFSGRKIEEMLRENIPMRWLAGEETPSYRTINRARISKNFEAILKEAFIQLSVHLVNKDIISGKAIHIDGTKLEADANKYSFVWKKSTQRYQNNLRAKIEKAYDEISEIVEAEIVKDEESTPLEQLSFLGDVITSDLSNLEQEIDECTDKEEEKVLKKKRSVLKKHRKTINNDYIPREMKYNEQLEILGERNSYSKTDTDATFMRMKDDHMMNGQLKAGYNIQIATENQFVLHAEVYSNPTDTRTLIPFIDSFEAAHESLPNYVVADAGYGSEENYKYLLEEKERTALIPYNMYLKEQTRKYKADVRQVSNWEYCELDDYYKCADGRRVVFTGYSKRTDKYGYTRDFKKYECEDCSGCQFLNVCCKSTTGKNRKIMVNPTLDELKYKAKLSLESEVGRSIYAKRKIDVEPVFGNIKANLGFTRFHLRGKRKVAIETNLIFMAHNFRKLAIIGASLSRIKVKNPLVKIFFIFPKDFLVLEAG